MTPFGWAQKTDRPFVPYQSPNSVGREKFQFRDPRYFYRDLGDLLDSIRFSDIKIAYRDIKLDGMDCIDKTVGDVLNKSGFGHVYVVYGKEAFGLWNVNHKKGDFADNEANVPGTKAKYYIECIKPKSVKESDAQLWQKIKQFKLTADYNVLTYNCKSWAYQAVRSVGLVPYWKVTA